MTATLKRCSNLDKGRNLLYNHEYNFPCSMGQLLVEDQCCVLALHWPWYYTKQPPDCSKDGELCQRYAGCLRMWREHSILHCKLVRRILRTLPNDNLAVLQIFCIVEQGTVLEVNCHLLPEGMGGRDPVHGTYQLTVLRELKGPSNNASDSHRSSDAWWKSSTGDCQLEPMAIPFVFL